MINLNTIAEIATDTASTHLAYHEDNGTRVTLEIRDDEVSMRREGEWETQCLFTTDHATVMTMITEEGALEFSVVVEEMIVNKFQLFIKYILSSEGHKVAAHEFNCTWRVENTYVK